MAKSTTIRVPKATRPLTVVKTEAIAVNPAHDNLVPGGKRIAAFSQADDAGHGRRIGYEVGDDGQYQGHRLPSRVGCEYPAM
jgi:hypothetical protein